MKRKRSNKEASVECDGCGQRTTLDKLAYALSATIGLQTRLDPGAEVPAGECRCGALAYLVKPKKKHSVVIEVSGGVAEVTRCPKEVKVLIKDHDNH